MTRSTSSQVRVHFLRCENLQFLFFLAHLEIHLLNDKGPGSQTLKVMSVRKRDNREIFEEGHGVPYVFNKLGLSILKNGKVVQEDEGDAGDEDFSEE